MDKFKKEWLKLKVIPFFFFFFHPANTPQEWPPSPLKSLSISPSCWETRQIKNPSLCVRVLSLSHPLPLSMSFSFFHPHFFSTYSSSLFYFLFFYIPLCQSFPILVICFHMRKTRRVCGGRGDVNKKKKKKMMDWFVLWTQACLIPPPLICSAPFCSFLSGLIIKNMQNH